MRSTRIKWVIALAVVLSGLWLMGVMFVLSYQPETYVHPGTVVTAPAPTYTPTTRSNRSFSPIRRQSTYHTTYAPVNRRSSSLPSVAMRSTSRLYTTSSAQQHEVGSGWNTGTYSGSQNQSSARGIHYSNYNAVMPQANFIAIASTRQMASPEAQAAPQMARIASGPNNAPPGPPNIDGPLDPSVQLVEQPIGDALLPLALLALAYALARTYKKRAKKAAA